MAENTQSGVIGTISAAVIAVGVIVGGIVWLGAVSANVDNQKTEMSQMRAKLDLTSEKLIQTQSRVDDLLGQVSGTQAQLQQTANKIDGLVRDVDRLLDSDGRVRPR